MMYLSEDKIKKLIRGIIIANFIFDGLSLIFLPSQIPMQWDSHGNVGYTLPSYIGVWIPPVISILVNLKYKTENRMMMSNLIPVCLIFLVNIAANFYIIFTA